MHKGWTGIVFGEQRERDACWYEREECSASTLYFLKANIPYSGLQTFHDHSAKVKGLCHGKEIKQTENAFSDSGKVLTEAKKTDPKC